jgi:hypothetical protein
MSTETHQSVDEQSTTNAAESIKVEHQRAQESGEVFEGKYPDDR